MKPRPAARSKGLPPSDPVARPPRADRIDIDVVATELLRRHPRQRNDGTLARGICGVRGPGIAASGNRGDVDDPAAGPVDLILPDHLARGALQTEKHALGVNPVDPVPIGLASIPPFPIPAHT